MSSDQAHLPCQNREGGAPPPSVERGAGQPGEGQVLGDREEAVTGALHVQGVAGVGTVDGPLEVGSRVAPHGEGGGLR